MKRTVSVNEHSIDLVDGKTICFLSESLGCYYCEKTFIPSQVTEYVGKNRDPLCPHCGIDAVVRTTDKSLLNQLHVKYFENTTQ